MFLAYGQLLQVEDNAIQTYWQLDLSKFESQIYSRQFIVGQLTVTVVAGCITAPYQHLPRAKKPRRASERCKCTMWPQMTGTSRGMWWYWTHYSSQSLWSMNLLGMKLMLVGSSTASPLDPTPPSSWPSEIWRLLHVLKGFCSSISSWIGFRHSQWAMWSSTY